jgi:hypothetical protein
MKAGDLVRINASSHFEFSAKYGLLVSPPLKTKKLTKWIGSPWESRRPVELIYSKEFEDQSTAQQEEYKFKQLTRKEKHEFLSMELLKKMV